MKASLDELRRTALKEPELTMLAAIEAIAARRGDNLAEIASVLFGAYVTLCASTGHGEALLREAAECIAVTRRELAAAEQRIARRGGN